MALKQEENQIIKIITPVNCPHCTKKIYVCSIQQPGIIAWALKDDDIKKIKEEIMDGVKDIKFSSEEKKQEIITWIESEETIFGIEDTEAVVESIKQSQKKEIVNEK